MQTTLIPLDDVAQMLADGETLWILCPKDYQPQRNADVLLECRQGDFIRLVQAGKARPDGCVKFLAHPAGKPNAQKWILSDDVCRWTAQDTFEPDASWPESFLTLRPGDEVQVSKRLEGDWTGWARGDFGSKRDCINFHPSLLPRHRGSLTQFWAIFDADEEAGTTCHRMVEEFDAGRILRQEPVKLAPDETALSLNHKLALATERCFKHVLEVFLAEGLPEGEEWDVAQFPYHFRRLPEEGFIDFSWPLDKVDRFIRAMYFPPFTPARLRMEDGSEHRVLNLSQYQALIKGKAPAKLFWDEDQTPVKARAIRADPKPETTSATPWMAWTWWPAALAGLLLSWVAVAVTGPSNPSLAPRQSVPGTQCIDGSPANLYLAHGYGDGRRKWVVFFQGGGWCTGTSGSPHLPGYCPQEDVAHPDLCEERSRGYHGSSLSDSESRDFTRRGCLSGDSDINPMMYNWNRVMVRNCDGTLFLSSAELPGLHLRGRDNAVQAIRALLGQGLADASELLFAGCSAGGVASVLLADTLRPMVEEAVHARGGRVFVAVLSDSGFFPDWSAKSIPAGVLHFPQFQWLFATGNVSAALPPECLAAGHGWRCMLLETALPYVKTPCFVLQSTVDSWQLQSSDQKSLESLHQHMRANLLAAVQSPHGGALDNCFHHCEAWGNIHWGGLSNREAFERWYRARVRQWDAGEDFNTTGEGWPLLHLGALAAPRCYPGQEKHKDWHATLGSRRLSDLDAAARWKMNVW
ncbi:unnamed protein product [Effrenium voratum]|nr:unnamed protein product [Effrenium voratum]